MWAISETEILLIGGIFDGEIMVYDDVTGNLVWQNVIYKPEIVSPEDN